MLLLSLLQLYFYSLLLSLLVPLLLLYLLFKSLSNSNFPLLGTVSRGTLTEIRALRFFIRFIPVFCDLEIILWINSYQKFVF